MTKFLLGVTVGYLLSDMIDEFLGKSAPEKPSTQKEDPMAPMTDPQPPTP